MRKLYIVLFLTLLTSLSAYSQKKENCPVRYDADAKKMKCDSIRGDFRLLRFSGKEVNNIKYDYILRFGSKHLRAVLDGERVYTDSLGNVIAKDEFRNMEDLSYYGIDAVIVEKDRRYGVMSADFKRQILPFGDDYINYSYDNTFSLIKENPSKKRFFSSGVANLEGKVIVPPIYDNISDFNANGLAVLTKDSIMSIIDKHGKIITSMSQDSKPLLSFFSHERGGLTIVRIFSPKGGQKYALMNNQGQLLHKPIYDIITGGKALNAIKKDGLRGLLNRKGEFVVPIEYDQIIPMNKGKNALLCKDPFFGYDGRRVTALNDSPTGFRQYQYIDSLGNIKISSSHVIKEVNEIGKDQLFVYMPNGYKIYDMDGNLTDSLPNTLLPARTWETFIDLKDGNKGFMDYWGQVKIPAMFEDIADHRFHSSYVRVYEKNLFGKLQAGVIDTLGNLVIPMKYDGIQVINDKNRFIIKKGKDIYFINSKGKGVKHTMNFIIGVNYNPLTNIIFEKNGKYGIYDIYGKEELPLIYDKYERSSDKFKCYHRYPKNVVVIYKNNKLGVWDANSKRITVPVVYDDLGCLDNDLITYKQNDKWGILNCKSGKVITPPIYESIEEISSSNIFKVQQNSLWGIIDITTGKNVTPIAYEVIDILNPDIITVRKDLLWGTIDKQGKEILPCRYDLIQYFNNDILIVGENVWCYQNDPALKAMNNEQTYQSSNTNTDSKDQKLRIVHREGVE